eukprot:COSAG01_NODE_1314_length_10760_cov_3.305131_6_plen_106_part_00
MGAAVVVAACVRARARTRAHGEVGAGVVEADAVHRAARVDLRHQTRVLLQLAQVPRDRGAVHPSRREVVAVLREVERRDTRLVTLRTISQGSRYGRRDGGGAGNT